MSGLTRKMHSTSPALQGPRLVEVLKCLAAAGAEAVTRPRAGQTAETTDRAARVAEGLRKLFLSAVARDAALVADAVAAAHAARAEQAVLAQEAQHAPPRGAHPADAQARR